MTFIPHKVETRYPCWRPLARIETSYGIGREQDAAPCSSQYLLSPGEARQACKISVCFFMLLDRLSSNALSWLHYLNSPLQRTNSSGYCSLSPPSLGIGERAIGGGWGGAGGEPLVFTLQWTSEDGRTDGLGGEWEGREGKHSVRPKRILLGRRGPPRHLLGQHGLLLCR